MLKVILLISLLSSFLFAKSVDEIKEKKRQEAIEKAIEQEKNFAKEQRFYKADEYDFKSKEVDEESLKDIPLLEIDELDMDNVYD